MKKVLDGPVLVGILVIAVIALGVMGYFFLSGSKEGEKPDLHPSLQRMYGPNAGSKQ